MIYKVKMFHKKNKHTESFEYCAYDVTRGGKWCGSHLTEEIPRHDNSETESFDYVMEKRVYGVTSYNAICRFMEWQARGLDNSFLIPFICNGNDKHCDSECLELLKGYDCEDYRPSTTDGTKETK